MEQQDSPRELVRIIVTLERPKNSGLKGLNRFERYRALRADTTRRRDDLIAWIEKEGLSDQVERIGKATAFNLLFLESTPEVAERIKGAPGVEKVVLTEGISDGL